MSLFAIMLRTAYKLSGAKKAFSLPEEELLKVIKKQKDISWIDAYPWVL